MMQCIEGIDMNINKKLQMAKREAKWQKYAEHAKVYVTAVPTRGANGEVEPGDMLVYKGEEYVLMPYAEGIGMVWLPDNESKQAFVHDEDTEYTMKYHYTQKGDDDEVLIFIDWVME